MRQKVTIVLPIFSDIPYKLLLAPPNPDGSCYNTVITAAVLTDSCRVPAEIVNFIYE